MILIADSGSTKTDWVLLDGQQVVAQMVTQGINPVHQDVSTITGILNAVLGKLGVGVTAIRFYGAGCTQQCSPVVVKALSQVFPKVEDVEVHSDLLAAARAVCGTEKGIACILGTGANSCLFDGRSIVDNVPPLGYILGDEGSGAVLGKMFLNALFKRALPDSLRDEYLLWAGLSYGDIINKVYRQPMPNRFLASCSLFIGEHLEVGALKVLVRQNFVDFMVKNVERYSRRDLSVGAVGSIAWHYRDILCDVVREMGYEIGKIIKSPMEGLVRYHADSNALQ